VEGFAAFLESILKNQLAFYSEEGTASEKSKGEAARTDKYGGFTPEERKMLTEFFRRCSTHRIRTQLIKTLTLIDKKEALEESRYELFGSNIRAGDPGHALDREITALLMFLAEEISSQPGLKNMSGLLMFYFSLYKLFQSDKIVDTLNSFVPRRRENGGNLRRDRHSQITSLVNHSEEYRKKYLGLIKRLIPLVTRQLQVMSETFELQDLLFHGPVAEKSNKELSPEIYARLTSSFVHEAVHSGLGILISFQHRPASAAFSQAASGLLRL
jgi:hypothetical protein